MRDKILHDQQRPDGRKPNEIRKISSEVNVLPRTHGSGLFTRGETQILSIATLGTLGEAQELVRQQYAAVGAAARVGIGQAVTSLQRAVERGLALFRREL